MPASDHEPASESDLWTEHKQELDPEWHDAFDALTAQGKSPSGIKAAIEYVTSTKSQEEVSKEFNISEVTIRNLQAAVIALGPLDARVGTQQRKGQQSALDLCTHIADRLGWQEGVEYSVNEPGGYTSSQPRLLKAGWQALHDELVNGGA